MAFNINEFRSQLTFDGARPNYFEIYLTFPGNVLEAGTASVKSTFMGKASQIPGSNIGNVPLYYFGREVKVPGNRTFTDWTVTIIQDEDYIIRNAFENWMQLINAHGGNIRDQSMVNFLGYSVNATVIQYGKAGDIIAQYDFVGLYPSDLAPIDLDWQSNDTIEEWNATLTYQYWTKTKPIPVTDL